MPRCRSTTFYLSPGVYRRFSEWAVWASFGQGRLVRVEHRNDIRRLSAENPGWDGTCLVVSRSRDDDGDVRARLARAPSEVEVWRLDERSVEGRRPYGAAPVVCKVARRGFAGVGAADSLKKLIEDPQTRATVAAAVQAQPYRTGQAAALRFLAEAARHLDRSGMAKLSRAVAEGTLALPCPLMHPSALDLSGLRRFDGAVAARVAAQLWRHDQESRAETVVRLAAHAHHSFGAGHPWVRFVSEWANQGDAAVLAGLAAFAEDHSGWGPNVFEAFDLDAETLEVLARRGPGSRVTAMLHPDAPPSLVESFLTRPGRLTRTFLAVPGSAVRVDTSEAITAWLSGMSLRRTDSALLAENITKLALLAAEAGAGPRTENHLRRAFSAWCVAVRNDRSGHAALDTTWMDGHHVALSAEGAGALWKAYSELRAHVADAAADAEARVGDGTGPSRPDRTVRLSPGGLAGLLAQAPDCPRRIVQAATKLAPSRRQVLVLAGARPDQFGARVRARASGLSAGMPTELQSAGQDFLRELARDPRVTPEDLEELWGEWVSAVGPGPFNGRHSHRPDLPVPAIADRARAAKRLGSGDYSNVDADTALLCDRTVTGIYAIGPDLVLSAASCRTDRSGQVPVASDEMTRMVEALVGAHPLADEDVFVSAALIGVDRCFEPRWADADRLAETAASLARADGTEGVLWPPSPRSVAELPRPWDRPWELDAGVVEAVQGRAVSTPGLGALRVSVIPDVVALRANANQMRNCTSSYAGGIAAGTAIMLALVESSGGPDAGGRPRTVANVSLVCDDGHWAVGELNSWANAGMAPSDEAALRAQLEAMLPTGRAG